MLYSCSFLLKTIIFLTTFCKIYEIKTNSLSFGMVHDTVKTGCENRNGRILHIMTPSFEADTVHVSWSNCSRRDITRFLE